MDPAVKNLLKAIEYDFRALRKELASYKYVVDIGTLGAKNRQVLRANGYNIDKHGLLLLSSKQELDKIVEVLLQAKENRGEEDIISNWQARTNAALHNILTQVSGATNRLASRVSEKVNKQLQYASPSFRIEFIDAVAKKISSYKVIIDTPAGNIGDVLKEKLAETIKSNLLKNIEHNKVISKAIDNRVNYLADVFEYGKPLRSYDTKYKERVSSKLKQRNKNYYVPLQEASGLFTSTIKIQNLINLILHDTIKDKYMKGATDPVSPMYLRYQTGRFARSARVTNIFQSGTVLNIDYTYMEDPYAVYESYATNRNPRRIIGAAIREAVIKIVHSKFSTNIRKV